MFLKSTRKVGPVFEDRASAGILLANKLIKYKESDGLVIIAIPRGGVIIADVVASKLPCNNYFYIIIPRKIGAPINKEISVGAIVNEDIVFLMEDAINAFKVSQEYLENEIQEQKKEIERRTRKYGKTLGFNLINLAGKTVILIDDGIASGATSIVAARWIRKNLLPQKLIIAVPVVPKTALELIKNEADVVETVIAPSKLSSVGEFYKNFNAVTDEQVVDVLRRRKSVTFN